MKYDNSGLDRYRKTITTKRNKEENKTYSGKTLDRLAKGQYRKVPELKKTEQKQTPKQTQTKTQSYDTSGNLRDRGFYGSTNNAPIDFDYVTKNDPFFNNALKTEYKAKHQSSFGPAINGGVNDNDAYYKRFGMSKDQVLKQYEQYQQGKERQFAESHPILNALKDLPSAPSRAMSGAAAMAAHKLFPYSDLDTFLNNDMFMQETKDVQRRRDYTQGSNKVSDRAKMAANIAGSGGDTLTNIALSTLLGSPMGIGDAVAGVGATIEPAKWVLPVLTGVESYGKTSQETKHELDKQGIDDETATDYANSQGIMWGIVDALTAGQGSKAGEVAKQTGKILPNVLKATGRGAALGGGTQAISEAVNKIILGDKGSFNNDVQRYLSQGMTEQEAGVKAFENALARVGGSAALGGILGGATSLIAGGAGRLLKNKNVSADADDLNNIFVGQRRIGQNETLGLPQNDLSTIAQNELPALTGPRQAYPMSGTQGVIPMPGTNGVIELPETGTPVTNSVVNAAETATRNPRLIMPLEGEKRTQALADRKSNSQRIRQLNKDIKAQEEVVSKASKKTKKAESQKLSALKAEKKDLQLTNKKLGRQINGGTVPVKEILEQNNKDLYDEIYKRGSGLMDNINYVAKHAGDTAEAKQLAKDIRNALDEFIETGDVNATLYNPETINKINRLDDLARNTDAEYIGHYEDNILFTDESGVPSIWNALEGVNKDGLGLTSQIGKFHDNLFDLDLQKFGIENPKNELTVIPETTSAPTEPIANTEPIPNDGQLTPEEVAVLQDVVDGKYDIPENGNLSNSTKIPEYTMGEDVYFNGSDADIAQAEAQDQAIVDTFKNMIADPEFNALSFKNGSKEVFVSPATNGNGLRMSYTIDGVPTGHHDYSFDQIDELSSVLRNEAGNGGENIKIQRKSDLKKGVPKNEVPTVNSNNGYWLRVLGDEAFLNDEAIANNVSPETLRQYAMSNLGYSNPTRRSFFDNVPPNNNIPHVDGTIPGDHTKTSKAYTNTGRRGGGWNEEEYDKHTDESMFQYFDHTEKESVEAGQKMRQQEGREGFKNRVMNQERLNSAEIDGLMMEWRDLTKEARDLETAGKDASKIWSESIKIFRKVQTQSSENAQALQALGKWSRATPEGMLVDAENFINGKTKPDQSKLQKELDKFAKRRKKFEFSEDFVKEFLKDAEEIQALTPNSPLAKDKMAELGRKINRQLPSTLGEKITSILMDNMLGNFRTLITRNAGGNVGLNAIEQLIQRPVAAGVDMLASLKTGRRTQAGLSREGLAEYIQGFAKGLRDEAHDIRTGLHTARTGENTLERAISANRHVFREGGLMDRWDSLIKNGLSVGDRPFYEGVYKQTLGDYRRLRATGKMGRDVQNLSDEEFKQYSEVAAKLNALAAVYQNDTMLSNALLGFKKSVGDLSRGIFGVDILSQFSMPFVKTPANVVDVGIQYSPLGLVRNAFRTGKEIHDENFDQNRFANETSRNILGTVGTGLGIAAAAGGLMSGGYSDDKDIKQAQKEAGEQEYALNLGDHQMDISWSPVTGSNAVGAAAAYDAYKNGEGTLAQNAMQGLYAGGKAMFDQSMFQGLQRLFGTSESYNTDEGIVGNMTNVLKSGLSQGVPSLARQVGQVIDPYERDLGGSNKELSFGPFDNYDINSLAKTVPWLRENVLAPKVNTSGELMKENQGRNVGMKILEDMILPGKLTKVEYSELNKEANRLKEETESDYAYLPKASRQYVDTPEHTLNNQEWVEYQQRYYKELTEAGKKIMQSDGYKKADAETQVEALGDAYSAIRKAINSEYTGKEVTGASKKYIEAGGGTKGVDAVVNSLLGKSIVEDAGINSQTKAGKEIMQLVEEGKTEEAKKQAQEVNKHQQALDALNQKYGTSMKLSDYLKKEASYEGGAEQWVKDRQAAEKAGMINASGQVQTKDYGKIMDQAGAQAAKMERDLPTLNGMDMPKSSYYTYAKAINVDPSLTPSQFSKTFNEIDTEHPSGKRSITQDEMLAYFNKHKMTNEREVMKLWDMYAPEGKKVPYLKKDGTWGKH